MNWSELVRVRTGSVYLLLISLSIQYEKRKMQPFLIFRQNLKTKNIVAATWWMTLYNNATRDLPRWMYTVSNWNEDVIYTDVDEFDEVVAGELKLGLVDQVDGDLETAVERHAAVHVRRSFRRLRQGHHRQVPLTNSRLHSQQRSSNPASPCTKDSSSLGARLCLGQDATGTTLQGT